MIYPVASLPSLTLPPSLPASIPHHQPPFSYLRVPRGGATTVDLLGESSSKNLDDSDIDRMVEDLIAGVDSSDQEADLDADNTTGKYFANNLDTEDDEDDDQSEETAVDNFVAESANYSDEPNPPTNNDEHINTVTTQRPSPIESQISKSESRSIPARPNRTSSSLPSNTIPTNAYYRFLVRRGPKGHILASFSLLTIQWLCTYIPFVYKSVASVLLTLRIYDPQLLHVKERERMLKEQRRREKTSLTDKSKSKFSSGGIQKSITICTIISACASATLFALITFSFVAHQQYGPINAPLVESEGRPCGYGVLGDPTLRQLFVATKNEYK